MRKLTTAICLTIAVLFGSFEQSHGQQKRIVEVYLTNQLDDDRGFCLDIKGHKTRAKIDRGLQAHTCYSYQGSISVDQGFDAAKLGKNKFFLPAF